MSLCNPLNILFDMQQTQNRHQHSQERIEALGRIKKKLAEYKLNKVTSLHSINIRTVIDQPSVTPSIQAPVEAQIKVLVQTSIETPREVPIETPIETPIEAPIEASIEAPIKTPMNASFDKTAIKQNLLARIKQMQRKEAQVLVENPTAEAKECQNNGSTLKNDNLLMAPMMEDLVSKQQKQYLQQKQRQQQKNKQKLLKRWKAKKQRIKLHTLSLSELIEHLKLYIDRTKYSRGLSDKARDVISSLKSELREQKDIYVKNEANFIVTFKKDVDQTDQTTEELFSPFDHRLLASILFYWEREKYRNKVFNTTKAKNGELEPNCDSQSANKTVADGDKGTEQMNKEGGKKREVWKVHYKYNRKFSLPTKISFDDDVFDNFAPEVRKFYRKMYRKQIIGYYKQFLEVEGRKRRRRISKVRELFEEIYFPNHDDILTSDQKDQISRNKAELEICSMADRILVDMRRKDEETKQARENRSKEVQRQREEIANRKAQQASRKKEEEEHNHPQKTDTLESTEGTRTPKADMFCMKEKPKYIDNNEFKHEIDRRMNMYKGYSGYASNKRQQDLRRFQKRLNNVIKTHVEDKQEEEQKPAKNGFKKEQVTQNKKQKMKEKKKEKNSGKAEHSKSLQVPEYKGDIFEESDSG